MAKGMCRHTFILVLFLCIGCASTKGIKDAAVSPDTEKTSAVVSAEKAGTSEAVSGEAPTIQKTDQVEYLPLPEFKKSPGPRPLPPQRPKEPIDLNKVLHIEGNVMLNAEAMPLSDFIIYALGDTLKITFFIDEQVKAMKNPVTIRMTRETPPEKALDIVIGFLEKYELIVEEKAGALYITKAKPPEIKKPVDVRIGMDVPDSPADVLQVVPLKYIKFNDIEYIVRIVYKANIGMRENIKDNTLLLSGPASSVKEIVDLIGIFDVPFIRDKKLFMLKLTYWQLDEFMTQLSAILGGLGLNMAKTPGEAGVLFIPIKVLNSILFVAPDEISMKYVLDWSRKLDTPESAGAEEKAFTYTPKYSRASEIVDAIARLYSATAGGLKAAAPEQKQQTSPAVAVPMYESARQQAAQRQTPALSTSMSTGRLKLAADDRRNIVLIHATPGEYKSILSYLENLDAPPRQVLLEATIAELTLKDDLNYGLEWYIKNRMKEGDYTLQTLDNLGLSTASGLAYQFITDTKKFQTAINAFAKENKINIISRPRLMVIDNEEASIQIGTDVPVKSGETKSTSADTLTTVTTQSIEYRTTGLILTVKPTINTEGLLTLDVSLESSEAQSNTTSDIDSPLILKRLIKSIIVAANNQSVILGGIMSDKKDTTESKVPLLGDIPLLGHLFKNTSKSNTKTELLIMITPNILIATNDAVKLTNELKQELKWMK